MHRSIHKLRPLEMSSNGKWKENIKTKNIKIKSRQVTSTDAWGGEVPRLSR
jgi:hypothetical protein